MRGFWVLPAALRLALAVQPSFNVYTDLLAFPQYDVQYANTFIHNADAEALLSRQKLGNIFIDEDSLKHDVESQQAIDSGDWEIFDTIGTYERMVFERVPYLCKIPYVAPPTVDNSTAATEEEQERELMRASDHGWELLQAMQGNCLYYAGGWWVYSFCYNEGIKQFHPLPPGKGGVPLFPPQEDVNIESYFLGKFEDPIRTDAANNVEEKTSSMGESTLSSNALESAKVDATEKVAATTTQLQTRGETNFLVQKLDGGTVCDLTGRPRRVEVQFHCDPSKSDHINLIKETSSCIYLMIIHTPLLCNDVAFLPPQVDKPNSISCREIVAPDDVENWLKWKESTTAKDKELQSQLSTNQAPVVRPLIIGGIEVGARKWVGGSPERQIKPSNIVTGPKHEGERFVARLAESDGQRIIIMSDKDIDKLAIKGAKGQVEEYRKRIKQLAGTGVPWKLDLYTTTQGWEFRMIIGADDSDGQSVKGDPAKELGVMDPTEEDDGEDEDDDDDEGEVGGSEEEYK